MSLLLIYTAKNCATCDTLTKRGFFSKLCEKLDQLNITYKIIEFKTMYSGVDDDPRNDFHKKIASHYPSFVKVSECRYYDLEEINAQKLLTKYCKVYGFILNNDRFIPDPSFRGHYTIDEIVRFALSPN